ncbi:nitrate/nitrite transporter [Halomarina salina]|uniref:Nitrate/nitrite transporter n=1 Tax=Halomarina salina TaxID=1872699 RepID=A0ABD5RP44_9EURY|nr:MFS transporter [Halomarina salina]
MTTATASDGRGETLDSPHGWLVVALGICMLTLIWGTVFTFTVYADRLAATFTLSELQVSSVFSITTSVFLAVGGLFGIFAARFPLRPVLTAVGVGLTVAALLLQVVTSYLGVLAAFALLGMAGGTAFTIIVSLAPQWFDTYQGLATSVTMTGVGLGPLVLPFAWLWLFNRTGFRTSLATIVGVMVAIVFVSSLFYRRPAGPAQAGETVDTAWIRRRVRNPRFLSTAIGFPLVFVWFYVLSAHLVSILTTNGIDAGVAAAGISVIGGVSVFTRVGGGFVGDRIGQRATFLMSAVLASVCALSLPFAHSRLLVYGTLFGLGVALGPLASLWSPIILTRFGQENATATVGLLNISMAGFALLAPLAVGPLKHMTGGYVVPLVALGVVTALGAGLFGWGTTPVGNRPERGR